MFIELFQELARIAVLILHLSMCTCQPQPCSTHAAPACTCWENYGQKSITCSYGNLEAIPDMYSTVVQQLDLSYNNISRLSIGDFDLRFQVKHLDLSHNQINNISLVAFSIPMSYFMESVDLSYNLLTKYIDQFLIFHKLETVSFAHNKLTELYWLFWFLPTSVKNLDISHNSLNLIHRRLPYGKMSKLRSLTLGPLEFPFNFMFDMTYHSYPLETLKIVDSVMSYYQYDSAMVRLNHLTELEFSNCTFSSSFLQEVIFDNVKDTLKILSLPYDKLKQVPQSLPRGIYSLDLSHNEIKQLFPEDFWYNYFIQYLYLQYNQITTIQTYTFQLPIALQYLDLSGNRLQQFPEAAFSLGQLMQVPVTDIRIGHNPWECTCDIKWIIDMIHEKLEGHYGPFQMYEIYGQLQCLGPPEYQGIGFKELATEKYIEYVATCDQN